MSAIMPRIGQGTWYLGEDPETRDDELAALRLGLDLGLTMIDTAEMYGDGAAEELVGEAIGGRRDEVFLVDKVLPGNASRAGTIEACHRSLGRLRTDRIDLYLLHWQGEHPLAETVEAFTELVEQGAIGQWGVSNLDLSTMEELVRLPGGRACAANQILYNPGRRGAEFDLLPWCREQDIAVMAYSPLEQGWLLDDQHLQDIADGHGVSIAQVALAWVLRQEGVVTLPRSGDPAHVRDNAAALDLRLTEADLAVIDKAFPHRTGRSRSR